MVCVTMETPINLTTYLIENTKVKNDYLSLLTETQLQPKILYRKNS